MAYVNRGESKSKQEIQKKLGEAQQNRTFDANYTLRFTSMTKRDRFDVSVTGARDLLPENKIYENLFFC
jgi:hypothetical protein